MLDLRATGEDVNRQDTVYVRVAATLDARIKPLLLAEAVFYRLSKRGEILIYPIK